MTTDKAVVVARSQPRSRTALLLEAIALHHQIAVLERCQTRLGVFYAAYVMVNMPLFILRYHGTPVMQEHSWSYLVPYPFVAIGVSSGAAWLLYRRLADLR